MSRVRVYLGCSLDGCIAGPEHDLSFLMEEPPEGAAPSDQSGGLGFDAFLDQVGVLHRWPRCRDSRCWAEDAVDGERRARCRSLRVALGFTQAPV